MSVVSLMLAGKEFQAAGPVSTLALCPQTCSFDWCLAEGYLKQESALPYGPLWLGKDFRFEPV